MQFSRDFQIPELFRGRGRRKHKDIATILERLRKSSRLYARGKICHRTCSLQEAWIRLVFLLRRSLVLHADEK